MYAVVASPSATAVGPLSVTVIGSLAAMVACALFSSLFTNTCVVGSDVVTAPRVTVNVSAPSDSWSSVTAIVIVCVDPAALFGANVTVPEVAPRSAASAPSVPSGALQATCTCAATAADRVTVKVAFPPSVTFTDGPLMLRSVSSSSLGSSVAPLWSLNSMVAELTVRPSTVVVPGMMIVSLPSTSLSSIGVRVSVPVPLVAFAGIVMLVSVPAV